MDEAVEQPSLTYPDPPSVLEAWEMVTGQLRAEVRRGDYESYVAAMQPLSFKEGVYRVGAINAYARDWVESRLTNRISKLLTITYGQPVTLRLTLVNGAERLADAVAEQHDAQETRPRLHPSARIERDRPISSNTGASIQDTLEGIPSNGVGRGNDTSPAPARSAPNGYKKKNRPVEPEPVEEGSSRKIQLQRAYGTERASVIQPERSLFVTLYLFSQWLPLIGHSAFTVILAARSLCYWNVRTGELRNTIETDMSELARRASVSVRTVKDVLNQELIKQYFLRYKVRRVMTSNGVRTAGIVLQVRMDDPLTPEDQAEHNLSEEARWYTADFENEDEE